MAYVIDAAAGRHSDRDVPHHLAFQARPISDCFKARQRLRFRLAPQLSLRFFKGADILLAARATANVNSKFRLCEPRQIPAQIQGQGSMRRVLTGLRGAQ
jgi:hypothetical protein